MNESELFRKAQDSAATTLATAIREIDAAFGQEGFAREHPELVDAFMRAAAADFFTMSWLQELRGIRCAIEDLADHLKR